MPFALALRGRFVAPLALVLSLSSTLLAGGGGSEEPVVDPVLARPHLVSMANDGRLLTTGVWGQTRAQVRDVFQAAASHGAEQPRKLVLYAHGGVTSEAWGLWHIAQMKRLFGEDPVHPVVFVWRTDIGNTVWNLVADLFGKAAPDPNSQPEDFLPDMLDGLLERLARKYGVGELWTEMKENARLASVLPDGGTRLAAEDLHELAAQESGTSVHMVGHSAGSILLAYMLDRLGEGAAPVKVDTVTLLAPACTVALFKEKYLPALRDGRIGKLKVLVLDDEHERADSVRGIYQKSILYLVSNAFEDEPGEPILGMHTAFQLDPELTALVRDGTIELVVTPNDLPVGSADASRADTHGIFGSEPVTEAAIRAVVLGASEVLSD